MNKDSVIGAIDAGGTTFKCAALTRSRDIIAYERIPTTNPEETFESCVAFFRRQNISLAALGIACFGPLNLDRNSADFGMIHSTPKPGWSGANPKQWLEQALSVPVDMETDVNAALLAEREWGAAQNTNSAVYITVGTGIGAGIYAGGHLLGAPHHPEFGHISIERHTADTDFDGLCRFHGNCLEGMAAAPALWKRFGDPENLPPNHIGWEIIADYMAQACLTLIYTIRPERILLGGGLMQATHVIDQIKSRVRVRLNDYAGISGHEVNTMITAPALGDDAGLMGGALLASK